VPYRCTVSGQVSGNLSRVEIHGECDIGQDPAYWLEPTRSWPSPFVKGALPNDQCNFTPPTSRGTPFNGFSPGGGVPPMINAFLNLQTGSGSAQACSVVVAQTMTNTNPSTMLQVLKQTNTGEQFQLGRVVVASLLNAFSLGNGYPVTTHTIIAMFNATFNGGTYQAATGVFWMRPRVIEYLESLYSPEGF
jgi:hypothetical protein